MAYHYTLDNILPKIKELSEDGNNGCIFFRGRKNHLGYGQIYLSGKEFFVHRIIAMLFLGLTENSTLHVLHSCDNPSCINKDHLRLGTRSDNMQDALKRGRFKGGYYNKIKTHCTRGHEYSLSNTRLIKGNRRECIACKRLRNAISNNSRKG